MRLRNKPWAKDFIKENSDIFITKESLSKVDEIFSNDNPIQLEIGAGKGDFLLGKAKLNPNINYIGIELQPSVIVIAGKKLEKTNLSNVKFLCMNVAELIEYTNEKQFIDKIYLNFSDPWPKNRHEKRRLTSADFLDLYAKLLKENAIIEMKTDNTKLFEYSVVSFSQNDWLLEEIILDLHNTDKENVKTEFERRFSEMGFPIKYLKARKND